MKTDNKNKKKDDEDEEEEEDEDEEEEEEEDEPPKKQPASIKQQASKSNVQSIKNKEDQNEEDDEAEEEEEENEDEEEGAKVTSEPQNQDVNNQGLETKKESVPVISAKQEVISNEDELPKDQDLATDNEEELNNNMDEQNMEDTGKRKHIEPSVYTRITQDLLDKKLNSTLKESTLNFLNDSLLINKLIEGKSKAVENKQKSDSFIMRNLEFREKKKEKLERKKEILEKEKILDEIKPPNNKVFNKAEIRSCENFFKEQMKHNEQREFGIKKAKEDREKDMTKIVKEKPEISENSKKILKDKHSKETKAEGGSEEAHKKVKVHDKLYQSKLNKQKKGVYKATVESKDNPVKKGSSQEEITKIIGRLYNEGIQQVKEKEEKIKEEINAGYELNQEEDLSKAVRNLNGCLISKFKREYDSALTIMREVDNNRAKILTEPADEEKEDYEEKKDEIEDNKNEKPAKQKDPAYLNLNQFNELCYQLKYIKYSALDSENLQMLVVSSMNFMDTSKTDANSVLDKKKEYIKNKIKEDNALINKAFNQILELKCSKYHKVTHNQTEDINVDVVFLFFISVLGIYNGISDDKIKESSEYYVSSAKNSELTNSGVSIAQDIYFIEESQVKNLKANYIWMIDTKNLILASQPKSVELNATVIKQQTKNATTLKGKKSNAKSKAKKEKIVISDTFSDNPVSVDENIENQSENPNRPEDEKPNNDDNQNLEKEKEQESRKTIEDNNNDNVTIKQKKKEKIIEYKKLKEQECIKECTFKPQLNSKPLPAFSNVNRLFETDINPDMSIREKYKNKLLNDIKQKEKMSEEACTFHPNINKM